MYRKIEVNAEHNEIILENSNGDKVIIPANKRNWVKQKLSEGCHGCIDSLVETLPVVNNYAQDGTVFPNEKQPIVLITPSGRKVETDTDSDFYRTHYNSKLIGKQNEDKSWNLTDEIYQGESLPEVVVTSKIQPNTFTDYNNQFNKNNPKDKFLKEFEINTRAVSDNTTSIIPTLQGNKILATPLETPLTPEQLNEKVQRKKAADAQEIQRRKDNISRSNSSKPFSRESFLNTAIGDKMRFFPNDPNSIIDEYINPLKWIGDMADNLGHTFADPNSSITDKAIALGTPLLVGAIGSNLGSPKISNNQFLNNVFNPLPIPMNSTKILNKIDNNSFYRQIGKEGYEDAIKTGVIRSNPVGEYAGKAPYFVEGKDFDNLYSTGAGAGGKKPEYIFEMPQLKNPEEMSAFRVNQQEGYAPYVAGSKEIPISQGKIYRLNNKNEYELIDATKAGNKILNKTDDVGKDLPKLSSTTDNQLPEIPHEIVLDNHTINLERLNPKNKKQMLSFDNVDLGSDLILRNNPSRVADQNTILGKNRSIKSVLNKKTNESIDLKTWQDTDGKIYYYMSASMPSSKIKAGRAYKELEKHIPKGESLLENSSLSYDSFLNILKQTKNPKFETFVKGRISMNDNAKNNLLKIKGDSQLGSNYFNSEELANSANKELIELTNKYSLPNPSVVPVTSSSGKIKAYEIQLPNIGLKKLYTILGLTSVGTYLQSQQNKSEQ